jgi:class 3 adenylate cyclase/pimeloyl-ACP methyl ester carboxylesterase
VDSDGVERKLAAILSADVVGYSRLMAKDEAATIRTLTDYREAIAMLVRQHRGRVVDSPGDNVLAEFPSALEAVRCAVEIQRTLHVRNADLPAERKMEFRIGVHLGDVVVEGDRIYRDGVNIAARLEGLAEPGGVCVSEPIYQLVRNRSHIRARSLGPQSLKNVDQPMKVFALATESPSARPQPRSRRVIGVLAGMAAIWVLGYAIYAPNRVAILSSIALTAPLIFADPIEQEIGFATTSDGVRIAYATTGEGPPLVFVLGWATHLERGFGSPLYDREGWIRWYSNRHLLVRYDGRGFGLSDRNAEDFSLDARVRDLEAVVDSVGLDRFAIYAVSAGGPTAIGYTVRHPERVSRLVFGGTFARGRRDFEVRRQWEGMISLFRTSWESLVVRSMMVTFLAPNANEIEQRVLSEFLRISGDGPAIAGFFQAGMEIDTRELALRIEVPTLVIHGHEDHTVPLEQGRDLASLIPGARFEIIRGADHMQALDCPKTRELVAEFLAPLGSS